MGVHLIRTEENAHAIDALVAADHARIGLDGVLQRLDRRARTSWVGRLLGREVQRAHTWDRADRRDRMWWPQGVSSSGDATDEGTWSGRELLVVAWYSPTGLGSRVTFVDLGTLRYGHVRLVQPDLSPLHVHAGGIVWFGPHLHVAATARGFVSFRLDDVLAGPEGDLVLPVRLAYRSSADHGHHPLRYSFLSLDRTSAPPAILAGEYARGGFPRFARFALDPETSLLVADESGTARPVELEDGGIPQMQGAVVVDGQFHVTVSHGPWGPGSLWVGRPGALTERRMALPMGPEDICWWPGRGELWSVTEHPSRRWFFSIRPQTR